MNKQIRVHRSLVTGRWVITMGSTSNKVGECDTVVLSGVTTQLNRNTRTKKLAIGNRSVHLWVLGDLVSMTGFVECGNKACTPSVSGIDTPACDVPTYYNPHKHDTFEYSDGREFVSADFARFDDRMYVSQ